mmetsp:Transcript_68311/g.183861  ORF Transcript_68311/g.183861 Transcript_68311/m.183861 type:complete len:91 (-) Transcript_68311:323-595(-)
MLLYRAGPVGTGDVHDKEKPACPGWGPVRLTITGGNCRASGTGTGIPPDESATASGTAAASAGPPVCCWANPIVDIRCFLLLLLLFAFSR